MHASMPVHMAPPPQYMAYQPVPYAGLVQSGVPMGGYPVAAPSYLVPRVPRMLQVPVQMPVQVPAVTSLSVGAAIRKVKGPWRPEEDKILTELVSRLGARRWTIIASHIPGRTGKQARERWLNQLSPDLAKRAWSPEEDRIVMQAHARLGNRWSEIAKLLKGRTDNATKNRFNTTIRRQISEMAVGRKNVDGSGVCSAVTSGSEDSLGKKGIDGGMKTMTASS